MGLAKTAVDIAFLINSLHLRKSVFNKQLHKRLFRCNLFVYVSYSRMFDFSCLFHKTDQFYVLRLYDVVC